MNTMDKVNFITKIIEQSEETPDRAALNIPVMEGQVCVGNESVTYQELMALVSQCQEGWKSIGLKKGDRVIVLIKPSIKLYVVVLSLLGLGLTPVFIDTGMGLKKIKMSIMDSKAKAIISMKQLLKMFWLIPPLWFLKRFSVDGTCLGVKSSDRLFIGEGRRPEAILCSETEHGLISFTSGSTGRPKGADRTHQSLRNQHLAIRAHWQDEDGEVDFPCFPVVVLHNLSCGMRTVLPKVDLASPGSVKADQVIEQFSEHRIDRISGAPAYMERIVNALVQQGKVLSEVGSVVVGGSTVPMSLVKAMASVFPNAECRVVYGSTEAEPIASININDLIRDDGKEDGYLVGGFDEDVEVLIARLPEEPVTEVQLKENEVQQGGVGEIVVSGMHVLKAYVDNPVATQENKIQRDNGMVWHRTGDVGFLDSEKRIWLTGRVKDVLKVDGRWLSPYIIEKLVDEMKGITRCALIQVEGAACFVFQEKEEKISSSVNVEALQQLLAKKGAKRTKVYVIKELPVDGRHNSKIDRPLLQSLVAQKKLVQVATWG